MKVGSFRWAEPLLFWLPERAFVPLSGGLVFADSSVSALIGSGIPCSPLFHSLRRAEKKDLEALYQLECQCFDPAMAFNRRQMQNLLLNPRADFWVLDSALGPVAQLLILKRRRGAEESARIYSLTVATAFRGQGLARQLLDWGLGELRRQNISRVCLEVEVSAVAPVQLYRSFGFQTERPLPHYYGQDRHGYKMALNLLEAR